MGSYRVRMGSSYSGGYGMKLFKLGRLGTGYRKMTLFSSKRLGCDLHILWFPRGSHTPVHVDPVSDRRHYRANIVLKNAIVGGHFESSGVIYKIDKRLYVFRPDIELHGVSRVAYGSRWVLSFGFVRKV